MGNDATVEDLESGSGPFEILRRLWTAIYWTGPTPAILLLIAFFALACSTYVGYGRVTMFVVACGSYLVVEVLWLTGIWFAATYGSYLHAVVFEGVDRDVAWRLHCGPVRYDPHAPPLAGRAILVGLGPGIIPVIISSFLFVEFEKVWIVGDSMPGARTSTETGYVLAFPFVSNIRGFNKDQSVRTEFVAETSDGITVAGTVKIDLALDDAPANIDWLMMSDVQDQDIGDEMEKVAIAQAETIIGSHVLEDLQHSLVIEHETGSGIDACIRHTEQWEYSTTTVCNMVKWDGMIRIEDLHAYFE